VRSGRVREATFMTKRGGQKTTPLPNRAIKERQTHPVAGISKVAPVLFQIKLMVSMKNLGTRRGVIGGENEGMGVMIDVGPLTLAGPKMS
jgi:hypothetical protein